MNEETTEPVIALIDDDTSVLKSVARFLKASGYQTVLFRSAEEFLADPKHLRFDCLVVDLQLGGMSGIELQEQLTAADVKVPMILMTARDEKDQDSLASRVHGAALMRKSDPGKELVATLGRLVYRSRHPGNGHRYGGNA